MSSQPNLSTPNHTFDETKQYKKVVFQQGKPILDIDLNDMSDAILAQTTSALAEKMGFGPAQLDYRDWALLNVEQGNPTSGRNADNFALSLGKIDTLKGVIDTSSWRGDGSDHKIIFDYHRLVDGGDTSPTDRPYSNYILKGSITEASDGSTITDEHKSFSINMGLTARTFERVITSDATASQVNSAIETPASSFGVRVTEGACLLVMVTGGQAEQAAEILSISNGGRTLVLGSGIGNLAIGDEYVIVPKNSLYEYRLLYNATSTQASSEHTGLNRLPRIVTYLQVFEEDVASEEDGSILSSALGVETTHRTQLRWCVRTALVHLSFDGDNLNGTDLTYLRLSHIFKELVGDHIDYQSMLDSVASADETLVTQYWRGVDNTGTLTDGLMGQMPSSLGVENITPMHFFASKEAQIGRLLWSFLKSIILRSLDGLNGYNDVQVLNMHHSETKSSTNPQSQTLTPYFYLGQVTDNNTTVHARLCVKGLYTAPDGVSQPAQYLAPMRLVMSQADMGEDIALSRSLYGPSGVLYGANAPLVFPSMSSHLSFVDQALIGLMGLGRLGADFEGNYIPSSIDYTPTGADASVAQSGYGVGAVKPISLLSPTNSSLTGFTEGQSQYLLRDKGLRTSHTVDINDEDLGWSLYLKEGSGLEGSDGTDLSLRSWHQGMAQAVAFQQGLNFRKLAIKTSAHKSADLFTISPRPPHDINSGKLLEKPSVAGVFGMSSKYKTAGSTLDLESYAGSANEYDANSVRNAWYSKPSAEVENLPSPLLIQYYSHVGADANNHIVGDLVTRAESRDLNDSGLGLWNRFNLKNAVEATPAFDPTSLPTDLWSNRATAMRLRYHVGDFYPGENDAKGIPANQLVDSLNLFVRIEPLSLTHWMTMPKHQHSILENSLVLAEGIEALLKVSHGIGDTQKLINGSGQPLVTETSPYKIEGSFPHKSDLNELGAIGDIDPYDLPFGHEHHPFVHWYHPAQNNLQMPHPSNNVDSYIHPQTGEEFKVTPYPKWGRRSLIVPALVPFKMESHNLSTPGDEHDSHEIPIFSYTDNGVTTLAYPDEINLNGTTSLGIDAYLKSDGTTVDPAVIPYTSHTTTPTTVSGHGYTYDNSTSEIIIDNQITFPALYPRGDEEEIGPVFIPASKKYLKQAASVGTSAKVGLGFNTLLKSNADVLWNNVSSEDVASFPYEELTTHYLVEASNTPSDLPQALNTEFESWSVPVMRSAIRTRTVAAIIELARTSFETALGQYNLPQEYSSFFTMPDATWNATTRSGEQTPAVGPDAPVDTLFVGGMGTAIGGYSERTMFASPLNLGVGALHVDGGLLHNTWTGQSVVRDSFEAAWHYASSQNATQPVLNTFWALKHQGLQQKLLFNCSFRVLHHRPSGRDVNDGASTMPKSLTEMFLVHDRTDNNAIRSLSRSTATPHAKPYLHLASMHPASSGVNNQTPHPNYASMSHLYPMVSDSIGGSHDTSTYTESNDFIQYNFENSTVHTTAMGDTFAVDPFDYMAISNSSVNLSLKPRENAYNNSGIEIEMLSELKAIHANPTERGLDLAGGTFTLIETMPTANELTLPGDHEIVFVLYTGHYGAKLFDEDDIVDTTNIPSVAGCHITATLELNRPSERISSTATDEHHYGVTSEGNPIKVYSIPSTT